MRVPPLSGPAQAPKPRPEADNLSAVLEAIPQPILVYDRAGGVLHSNGAARAAVGIPDTPMDGPAFEEAVGRRDLCRRDGTPFLPREFPSRRALRGEVVRREFASFTGPSGERLSYEISGYPLTRDGEVVGAVTVWNDLTYRVRFADEVVDGLTRQHALHLAGLEALLSVSTEVLSQPDPRHLLARVTEASLRLTRGRFAFAGRVRPDGRFRVRSVSRAPDGAGDASFGWQRSLQDAPPEVLRTFLEAGESLRLRGSDPAAKDSPWGLLPDHPPLRDLLGVRLSGTDGRPSGLLVVTDRQGGDDFTAEDESLLKQLAAITSLALQNIEARVAAENERLRLEAVIRALPVGLLVVDRKGHVLQQNDILRQVWGAVEGGPGERLDDYSNRAFLPDSGRPLPVRDWGLARALEQGESVTGQAIRIERFDGGEGFVLHSAAPVLNSAGEIAGGVAVVQDIGPQVRAEAQLKLLNDTLEQRVAERTEQLRQMASQLTLAEQQARQRLAHILHDHIQQSLAAAKLHVGLLRQHVGQGLLEESARQADDLLRQAIDTSRSLTVELSPPILGESGLAAGLEWLARTMRDKHGLAVEVSAEDGADPPARETRYFLFEGARELLFNVVKHAGVGQATVRLRRFGNATEMQVEDSGNGFLPEGPRGRGALDGGFGLFSIRQRAELLGGSLTIDSRPGGGCRIALQVPDPMPRPLADPSPTKPARAGDDAVLPSEAPSCDWMAGPRIRVLLADDHRMVRQGLVHLLCGEPDIEVVGEASDGRMAVEAARATRPDVVVMDVSMPRMNGLEATRLILAEFPEIRVVGLSMFDEKDLAEAMRAIGASAYVTKGGPSGNLLAAIRESVRASR